MVTVVVGGALAASPAAAASDVLCARAAALVAAADPGAALVLIDEREQELRALTGDDVGPLCPGETADARDRQDRAARIMAGVGGQDDPATVRRAVDAAAELDARNPDVVRLGTTTTWWQDRGARWESFRTAWLDPAGAPATTALAVALGWVVLGRVLVQVYPSTRAFRSARHANRRIGFGVVGALLSGIALTLVVPSVSGTARAVALAGVPVLGAVGSWLFSSGLAGRLRIRIEAASSDGTVTPSVTRTVAILRRLGADPPRGVEVPVGTDVSVLQDAVTKIAPAGGWLASVLQAASAVLGFTPWKVVLDVASQGTSVVVSRNGRTVAATIVRADVLGPGMPTANRDALVAAFLLVTLADGYRGRHGFEGLLDCRSWLSLGLVASTQKDVAAPTTTDAGERRRMLCAAALVEDNAFTRMALHENLYRDAVDPAVSEGYAQWLYDQAAAFDVSDVLPGGARHDEDPQAQQQLVARPTAEEVTPAVAAALDAQETASRAQDEVKTAARVWPGLPRRATAAASKAATDAAARVRRAALAVTRDLELAVEASRCAADAARQSPSLGEVADRADSATVELQHAADKWADIARRADETLTGAPTATGRPRRDADDAASAVRQAVRALTDAAAAARAASDEPSHQGLPAVLRHLPLPRRTGAPRVPGQPALTPQAATRLRLLGSCVVVTLNVLKACPGEPVARARLRAAFAELVAIWTRLVGRGPGEESSGVLPPLLADLEIMIQGLGPAVETFGAEVPCTRKWSAAEQVTIRSVALTSLGPRAYNAMCRQVAAGQVDAALSLYRVTVVDADLRAWSAHDPWLEPMRRRSEMWALRAAGGLLDEVPFAAHATALREVGLTSAATIAATSPGVLAALLDVQPARARRLVALARVLRTPERVLVDHLPAVVRVLVAQGATDPTSLARRSAAVAAALAAEPGLRPGERAALSAEGADWVSSPTAQ